MNILHISNTDLAGGRFNGFYMQQALDKSFNVEMEVWNKRSRNSNVHRSPLNNIILSFLSLNIRRLGTLLGFDGLIAFGGWILPLQDYFKRADIIHLHQIHNHPNFSILSLPFLTRKKPVVWTIHDPWAFTGGCEHSFDCNSWQTGCKPLCPHPRRRSLFRKYTPFLHWKIKKWVYSHSNLTLVVASEWMKNRIKQSPLLSHLPCYNIPFGIDLDIFKTYSKSESRKKMGINIDHRVIAFRGIDIEKNPKMSIYKGISYLLEALELYVPNKVTTLLIFENGKCFQFLSSKYNILTLGWIDGEELAVALSAADIFLMPSIQESFGLMAVEAMASGTPVIVFEGTSLPDVIKAPFGGVAVKAKNSKKLAEAIEQLMENDELRIRLSKQARLIVENEYAFPLYVNRHISLYEDVIKSHQKF